MKKCPFCGADIEGSARFCLYCMQSLTEKEQIPPRQRKKPQRILIVAAIVAMFLLLTIIWFSRQHASENEMPVSDLHPNSTSSSLQTNPSYTQSTTVPSHVHSYSVANTSVEYQKEDASCITPAVFYYSCACGEKGSNTFSHGTVTEHTIVTDPGRPASCVNTGLTDGSHCSICNTVFLAQTQVPVISHTFDNGQDESCNVCNFVRVINCDHAETIHLTAVSPTCVASGLTAGKQCALCEELLVAQSALAPLGHIEAVSAPAVAATCTTPGRTEEKHCLVCNVVTQTSTPVNALGHTEFMYVPAIAATCTTEGKTEEKHCLVCNVVTQAPVSINALGHTEVIDPAVAPSCTTAGKTEGKHCSVCNTVLLAQTPIPGINHTFDNDQDTTCNACNYVRAAKCNHAETVKLPAVPSTCTSGGLTEGKKCALCDEILTAQTTLAPIDHTVVTEPGYPAGCTTTGLTHASYCSVCNNDLESHTTIPAIGHTFALSNSPSACLVCGEMGTVAVHAPDFRFFQNKTFRIDSITYSIRQDTTEGVWEISVNINCTNLTSSSALMSPDCSMYFYNADGSGSGYIGYNYTHYLQPNESGTCIAYFRVPDNRDTFELIIV